MSRLIYSHMKVDYNSDLIFTLYFLDSICSVINGFKAVLLLFIPVLYITLNNN